MIKRRDTFLPLTLKWSRILMSHVGKCDHGLEDGRLDLAFQKKALASTRTKMEPSWEKKRGKEKINVLGRNTFQNTNTCQPYQFGLKMTTYSSSSFPPFLTCWPTEFLDTWQWGLLGALLSWVQGHDACAQQPSCTCSVSVGCAPPMGNSLHVCSRIKYACVDGLIWDFLDL